MISTAQLKPENSLPTRQREIASIQESLPGPTLIIVGGIHGNDRLAFWLRIACGFACKTQSCHAWRGGFAAKHTGARAESSLHQC